MESSRFGRLVWCCCLLGAGCSHAGADGLQKENARLARENEALRQSLKEAAERNLKVAQAEVQVVTSDPDVIAKFSKAAKRISAETGVEEHIVLHNLARSWDRELQDRKRDARALAETRSP